MGKYDALIASERKEIQMLRDRIRALQAGDHDDPTPQVGMPEFDTRAKELDRAKLTLVQLAEPVAHLQTGR